MTKRLPQLGQRYAELCNNLEEANRLLGICHTDCVELLRRAALRRDAVLLSRILVDCDNCPLARQK